MPQPDLNDKFVASNDQFLVILATVIAGIAAVIGFVYRAQLSDKKELVTKIDDNRATLDKDLDSIREKLQDRSEALSNTIATLNTSSLQLTQKMEIFIQKANDIELQLAKFEGSLTKRIDFCEKHIEVLERQNAVLFNYLQRFIRTLAVNESHVTDMQYFLESAHVDVTNEAGEVHKRSYKKAKPHIDSERLNDLKNIVSDYSTARLPLYLVTPTDTDRVDY